MIDALVLGAGVGGFAAAGSLAETRQVTVLDGAERCGGAHRSVDIGPYTFDCGSFFFEPRHPWFEEIPSLREQFVVVTRRQRRIDPRGTLRDYPFEPRELAEWPLPVKLAVAREYLFGSLSGGKAAQDTGTLARRALGPTAFAYSGLETYVEKLNSLNADAMDEAFFHARMSYLNGQISPRRALRLAVRALSRKPLRSEPRASLLVRPRDGFGVVYDELRRSLEARGVSFALGEPVRSIERDGETFAVQTAERALRAERVVTAIPLSTAYRAVFGREAGLESRDLLTLFVSGPARGERERRRVGNVLFNFHPDGQWKRLTVHSDFYELATERSCFSVEITLRGGQTPDAEAAFADFRDHVVGLGIFDPQLRLEGHELTPGAYPLLAKGSAAIANRVVEELRSFGIEPVGRQGRFDYLPTSSIIVRRTRKLIEEATATRA